MKINNKKIDAKLVAYDECHKIYLIEDAEDREQAIKANYVLYPINYIKEIWENSCSLRFISNWKLTKSFVAQFEEAIFTY